MKTSNEIITLNHLNKEQQEAVLHTSGPLLVIAGAGSGKTRVITHRISHLIENVQVTPTAIVALTFTNKAAQEMKERLAPLFVPGVPKPFIGTFHAYCLYLLHLHKELLPFEKFSIFDEEDKHSLLTKLLKKSVLYKKQTPQQISYLISNLKNQTLALHDQLALIQDPHVRDIITLYEKEKKASNAFDFDDLLIETVGLLQKNSHVRDWHHYTVRHILVDEYQDTNQVQHFFLKLMALTSTGSLAVDSVCAVGDEDQSIYSWRGATVDNILHFQRDFAGTQLIKMEQNYRSQEPILAVANAIIAHNDKRNKKNLWSERKGKDCVRLIRCLSGYQEADIIGRYCHLLYTNKKLTSTGILYRTHFQSRLIEEALIKHSVPYTIVGGIRFYERKEIKDLIAFLRLIVNPFDKVAFSRVINCPTRGLGDAFQELFLTQWSENPLSNVHVISQKLLDEKLVTGVKAQSLESFLALFKDRTASNYAPEVLSDLIAKSGYIKHLKDSYEKQEADERIENIQEFVNAAHFFAAQGKESIEALLNEISLLQEKTTQDSEQSSGVTLMTIHAAKGLEFSHVIIAGLEEGLFPSSRSISLPDSLEEERRLFYVAITRARETLLITHARFRQSYGSMEEKITSRFLDEVPQKECRSDDSRSWQTHEIKQYFSQWHKLTGTASHVMTFSNSEMSAPVRQPVQHITTSEITPKNKNVSSVGFKKHQTVRHATFGLGIIQNVEQKSEKTLITARFKQGVKIIDASFLQGV